MYNSTELSKEEFNYIKNNKLQFHKNVLNQLKLPDSINYLYDNPKPKRVGVNYARFVDYQFESIYVQYETDDYPIIPSLNEKSDLFKSFLCKFDYIDNKFKFNSIYIELSHNLDNINITNTLRFDKNLNEMFNYVFHIKNNFLIHEKRLGNKVIATYDIVETDKNKKNLINTEKYYKSFPTFNKYLLENKIIDNRTDDVFPFIKMTNDISKNKFKDITYLSISGNIPMKPPKTHKIW